MVDVIYPLHGQSLPRDHRLALAEALEALVPWLAEPSEAGVHPVNVVAGLPPTSLLSGRARLTLRVQRRRVAELAPLAGATLDLGGHIVRVDAQPTLRELLPYSTLYAHLVTTDDDDELQFLGAIDRELGGLGVTCRPICGRRQVITDDGIALTGYSLMLDGLTPAGSLCILQAGLGRHRRLGCGLFIPHKSAVALRA